MALTLGGCMGFSACRKSSSELTVYMPDGAPAIAMAKLLAEDTKEDGVDYRVVASTLVATKVTAKEKSKNADLCVLPVTAASKLLGTGEYYTLLGTLTHGNLYLIAKGRDLTDVAALVGKRVGVLQIDEVPGLTLKTILQTKGVAWQVLKDGAEAAADKVNLVAIMDANAVGSVEADYFLFGEPAATAQSKKGYRIVGDLQALYGDGKGYPQAVLVAKKTLVHERAAWIESFLKQVEESGEWLKSASGEQIVEAVSSHLEDKGAATGLKAPLLTTDVVARCSVRFSYAADEYLNIEEFLSAMQTVDSKVALPSRAFYWNLR